MIRRYLLFIENIFKITWRTCTLVDQPDNTIFQTEESCIKFGLKDSHDSSLHRLLKFDQTWVDVSIDCVDFFQSQNSRIRLRSDGVWVTVAVPEPKDESTRVRFLTQRDWDLSWPRYDRFLFLFLLDKGWLRVTFLTVDSDERAISWSKSLPPELSNLKFAIGGEGSDEVGQ